MYRVADAESAFFSQPTGQLNRVSDLLSAVPVSKFAAGIQTALRLNCLSFMGRDNFFICRFFPNQIADAALKLAMLSVTLVWRCTPAELPAAQQSPVPSTQLVADQNAGQRVALPIRFSRKFYRCCVSS